MKQCVRGVGVRRSALALLGSVAIGCASARADPPLRTDPTPSAHTAPSTDARARVRFDLAAHFERAETAVGTTPVIDLGAPGGAKHASGGWMTHVGPDRTIDGTTAALTTHSRAHFMVRAPGATQIAVRLRSFRPGPAVLYLDDREIATTELAPDAWHELRVSVAPLAEGEHELTLRFERGRDLAGVGRTFLAVDRIVLGDATVPDEAPEALERAGVPTLVVPDRWSVAYSVEVMRDARLRGVVEGRGTLEVWAQTDREPARRIHEVAAPTAPRAFDVSLSPFAGDVARIELRARGGSQRLSHPAIVTLDATTPPRARPPRHVLVYLIDTLRADRLSVYEPRTRVQTPGLTRFAGGATVFERAHSQENWTKPSVATLLSSLMPWEHTAFGDASVVPPSVRLLPEILDERGFTTAGFVANGYVSQRFGFERGWDRWRNYIREGRNTRGEAIAADVLQWLDDRPADRPFFLYVHAIDPHVPYRPPEQFVRMYDPAPYRGPVDFSRDATLLERIKTGGLRLGSRDRERLQALYDGEVSYQDAQLAAILDGLERRGLADETMVVITADHGEEFWDHGSVGHGHNLHQELIHVPLIVRMPGLDAAPRRVDASVGLVDVAPTILEALGEPVPPEMSGRSLWPALQNAAESAPRSAVAGFMENWRSVVCGRFKLIARSRGRIAVYDLADDPGETRDRSAERPITTAYLRGLLGLRLAEANAPARARRVHRASDATIDPELEAQLRALGYVGTSRRR